MESVQPAAGRLKPLLLVVAFGLFVQLAGLLFNNDGSRYIVQVNLLLFLPALLLLARQRLAPALWRQRPAILLLALMAWGVLEAAFNHGSDKSLGAWLKVMALLLLYVSAVASLVRYERWFARMLLAAVVVAALFAWLTLYYQFAGQRLPLAYEPIREARFRLALGWGGFANLDHPVVAGLYYGVFAVVLTWLFVRQKVSVWQGLLLGLAMAGLALYVLFSFSRGAWFSLLGGGLVLLLLFPNARSRSLLAVGGLALLLALYLFWPEIQSEREVGVSNREWIWAAWFERLPAFWLWGGGAGADFVYKFDNGFWTVKHAHSLYLQLWFEFGIVGIALFAALLLSLLWKGWVCRARPLARLGLALLVFAMVAMVSDVYAIFMRPGPYWVLFWFPVGILLGVQRPAEGEAAS